MKIAIDYDGTLIEHPDFYREFIVRMHWKGNEIGILTGRPTETEDEDKERLALLGIKFGFFINTGGFNNIERDLEYWSKTGDVNMDRDEIVCMFKARICVEEPIDVLFDDAADKVRLFMPEECKTIVFKSPSPHNMVVKKWGSEHLVDYGRSSDETVTRKRANS